MFVQILVNITKNANQFTDNGNPSEAWNEGKKQLSRFQIQVSRIDETKSNHERSKADVSRKARKYGKRLGLAIVKSKRRMVTAVKSLWRIEVGKILTFRVVFLAKVN